MIYTSLLNRDKLVRGEFPILGNFSPEKMDKYEGGYSFCVGGGVIKSDSTGRRDHLGRDCILCYTCKVSGYARFLL